MCDFVCVKCDVLVKCSCGLSDFVCCSCMSVLDVWFLWFSICVYR